MVKSYEELCGILNSILKKSENECIEFKKAKNDFNTDTLGKYFSAISNEATLKNKQYGWIIFGVDDKTHELTNTKYRNDNNFNDIKKQISDNTTGNITFIEVYNFEVDNNRVIMFQVPAATGLPTGVEEKRKNNRVRYIINSLKEKGKIINIGSYTKPIWILNK